MKIAIIIAAALSTLQMVKSLKKGRGADVFCNAFVIITLATIGRYYI